MLKDIFLNPIFIGALCGFLLYMYMMKNSKRNNTNDDNENDNTNDTKNDIKIILFPLLLGFFVSVCCYVYISKNKQGSDDNIGALNLDDELKISNGGSFNRVYSNVDTINLISKNIDIPNNCITAKIPNVSVDLYDQ